MKIFNNSTVSKRKEQKWRAIVIILIKIQMEHIPNALDPHWGENSNFNNYPVHHKLKPYDLHVPVVPK